MPLPNMKNAGLSPAVTDLGLGDMLSQQVQDETEEAKKRRQRQQQLSALSPATQALLGTGDLGRTY